MRFTTFYGRTMTRQREVLSKIKAALKETDYSTRDFFEVDNEDEFIYVCTKDGLIGIDCCHYEFVFHPDDMSHLSLEVHFWETKDNYYFEEIKDLLPPLLEFASWYDDEGLRRIRYTAKNAYLSIDDKDIVKKALNLLRNLDNYIGEPLKKVVLKHPELRD
ncbi:hypothetical protein TRSA_21930 (plasmid) [Treponema saccharophilum]|uniref:Uncharacterized protein n=2 Tax=Treponema saccharophilum TaxID=165 RepID=H7EKY9_9SPIR|nr:hypothetical protein TresaDRAFT_1003 [Treponema saccharophilum DSM 2985]BDC97094.1 hypothetical protein TRSA_21930 [Treponema saccharophilum]